MDYAMSNAARYQRSAEAQATLGWCYFKTGKLEEAERALGMATNSGQASPDTAYYMSKVLFDKKKFKEAYEVLKKAIDSKGVFINRNDAVKFMTDVKDKYTPPPEKVDPKDKKDLGEPDKKKKGTGTEPEPK